MLGVGDRERKIALNSKALLSNSIFHDDGNVLNLCRPIQYPLAPCDY